MAENPTVAAVGAGRPASAPRLDLKRALGRCRRKVELVSAVLLALVALLCAAELIVPRGRYCPQVPGCGEGAGGSCG